MEEREQATHHRLSHHWTSLESLGYLDDGIFRGPEKKIKLINCQVLRDVAVSFVAQSLHNEKVQGLSQVLDYSSL